MSLRALLVGIVLAIVCASAALAHAEPRTYVPKAHAGCRAGYVARTVRVRERKHHRRVWVRRRECVLAKHKAPNKPVGTTGPTSPAGPTSPTGGTSPVSFRTTTDPTFVQSATNPLAVTYSYSADATETDDGVTVDLGTAGELPPGVLNFYSETAPYSPMSLYCSTNVGGSDLGATCPIAYPGTGTFEVTTEYIPNSASAVTETAWETISPFSTTTTLTATQTGCDAGNPPPEFDVSGPYCSYTLTAGAVDQNGNPMPGSLALIAQAPGGLVQGDMLPQDSCTLYVTAIWVVSSDCNFDFESDVGPVASWPLSASFEGTTGWSPSTSPIVTLTP